MDSTKIKDWLEIVGIFGVIASLLVVGMEMRQSQQIAIATINSQRADTYVQILMSAATNSEFMSLFTQAQSGDTDSWTEAERNTFGFVFAAELTRISDTYWQYRNGFVPEFRWLAVREQLKHNLSTLSPAREMILSGSGQSDEMEQVYREILAEIDAGK